MPGLRGRGLVGVECPGAEAHQVRAAKTFLQEVDGEAVLQLLAIPGKGLEELLVGIAGLWPAAGSVDALLSEPSFLFELNRAEIAKR